MKSTPAVLLALSLLALPALSSAQSSPSPSPTTAAPSLTPEMQSALQQLNSDAFDARQKATAVIQQILARQLQALLATNDPETQARLTEIMEYNEGLSRWAIDTLQAPPEHRAQMLHWGLTGKNALMVAKAYATKEDSRVDACKQLATIKDDDAGGASALLATLLNDPDRAVSLAAMEAVWDRPATPAIIDALWSRAVDSSLPNARAVAQPRMRAMQFRGQPLPPMWDAVPYGRANDNNVATEVLIHLKSPLVPERLKSFFDDTYRPTNPNNRFLYISYTPAMINVYRMVEAYKPRELIPVLIHFAQQPVMQRAPININNHALFSSNRTAALVLVIQLTGQNPDDYRATRVPQANNMWTFPTEKDEDDAVTKIAAWWEKNRDAVLNPPATSQPATTPASEK